MIVTLTKVHPNETTGCSQLVWNASIQTIIGFVGYTFNTQPGEYTGPQKWKSCSSNTLTWLT